MEKKQTAKSLGIGVYRRYTGKTETVKLLNTLLGIIDGIEMDGVIKPIEHEELVAWLQDDSEDDFRNQKPLNEIIPIVIHALEDKRLTEEERETIRALCVETINKAEENATNAPMRLITGALQKMQGTFHGILADNLIHDAEIEQLQEFIKTNIHLRGLYPYDELQSIIRLITADGKITDDEREILADFLSDFIVLPKGSKINIAKSGKSVAGICATNPEIIFLSKTFCFTGKSSQCTRTKLAEIVVEKGGHFHDVLAKETDYLIIGDEGNPTWSFACYGRKVETAIKSRKAGGKIIIAHENDFWSAV